MSILVVATAVNMGVIIMAETITIIITQMKIHGRNQIGQGLEVDRAADQEIETQKITVVHAMAIAMSTMIGVIL